MPLYSVSRARSALSTSNDLLTITASATKPLRVLMGKIAGADTASASNTVLLARSSGGTTAGGSITPVPIQGSSSASFTVATTWSAQPTLGNVLHRFAPNSNGGIDPFTALPGAEFSVPVGGQISLRSEQGTGNVVVNLIIEEVEG